MISAEPRPLPVPDRKAEAPASHDVSAGEFDLPLADFMAARGLSPELDLSGALQASCSHLAWTHVDSKQNRRFAEAFGGLQAGDLGALDRYAEHHGGREGITSVSVGLTETNQPGLKQLRELPGLRNLSVEWVGEGDTMDLRGVQGSWIQLPSVQVRLPQRRPGASFTIDAPLGMTLAESGPIALLLGAPGAAKVQFWDRDSEGAWMKAGEPVPLARASGELAISPASSPSPDETFLREMDDALARLDRNGFSTEGTRSRDVLERLVKMGEAGKPAGRLDLGKQYRVELMAMLHLSEAGWAGLSQALKSRGLQVRTIAFPDECGRFAEKAASVPGPIAEAAPSVRRVHVWRPPISQIKGFAGLEKLELPLPRGIVAMDLQDLHRWGAKCPAVDVRCPSDAIVYFAGPPSCKVRQLAQGNEVAMAKSLYFPCRPDGTPVEGIQRWGVPGLVYARRADGWDGTDPWRNMGLQKRAWDVALNCVVDGKAPEYAKQRASRPWDPYAGKVVCAQISQVWGESFMQPRGEGERFSMRGFQDARDIEHFPFKWTQPEGGSFVPVAAFGEFLRDQFRSLADGERRLFVVGSNNHAMRCAVQAKVKDREEPGMTQYDVVFEDPNHIGTFVRGICNDWREAAELFARLDRFAKGGAYWPSGFVMVAGHDGSAIDRKQVDRYLSPEAASSPGWAWQQAVGVSVTSDWSGERFAQGPESVHRYLQSVFSDKPRPARGRFAELNERVNGMTPLGLGIATGNLECVKVWCRTIARATAGKLTPGEVGRTLLNPFASGESAATALRLRAMNPALLIPQLQAVHEVGRQLAMVDFAVEEADIAEGLPSELRAALLCGVVDSDASASRKEALCNVLLPKEIRGVALMEVRALGEPVQRWADRLSEFLAADSDESDDEGPSPEELQAIKAQLKELQEARKSASPRTE